MKDSTETGEPGNYGVGFPNFLGKVEDPEARKSKLAAELANGRLAMMVTRQHISMFHVTMERLESANEWWVHLCHNIVKEQHISNIT